MWGGGVRYHIVSPQAVSLRHLALAVTERLFDHRPVLQFAQSWAEFERAVGAEDAAATLTHIEHSPSCSVEKLRQQLGFTPRHDSISMVADSARWLIDHGRVPGMPA
eukprot:COSAG01_NODE_1003_length_12216_cov_8.565350_7_plen_107_part_00